MPTALDVASQLVQTFDQERSVLLEEAVLEALSELGVSPFDAPDIADVRFVGAVRSKFEATRSEELPFDLSTVRPDRLIGKKRVRASDNRATRVVRERIDLIDDVAALLTGFGDIDFEHLCAAILLRNGASEARVTPASDDGGIDAYGRLPVLVGDGRIAPGLVRDSLEIKDVLFMVQAKRHSSGVKIERGELQKFAGQVRDCLTKYTGVRKKPSHRVPEEFYVANELCLTIFMTTAGYSSDARSYAEGMNMVLADGRLISELLIAWGAVEGKGSIQSASVAEWSRKISRMQA